MDEIRRSLAALYEANDLIAEAIHKLADLADSPHLSVFARHDLAEAIHALADRIEELD